MDTLQDYYMELESGAAPLPILVNGSTHEERVALARAYVSQRYAVIVNMPLSPNVASVFRYVRSTAAEGQITVFSFGEFERTVMLLAQEGRRLACACLLQGMHTNQMTPSYERAPLLERVDNLELESEPITIPGGETFFSMTRENALRFMAETIRDEAIFALQDAALLVN